MTIRDRRAAAVMRACQELPGQQLFRYVDEAGEAHGVSSADVNAYLKSASGRRISAKDFRTWGGTLLCALALAAEPPAGSAGAQAPDRRRDARDRQGARQHRRRLSASYVHPGVLSAHSSGDLHRKLGRLAVAETAAGQLKPHEAAVLRLLRRLERAAAKSRSIVAALPTAAIAAPPARASIAPGIPSPISQADHSLRRNATAPASEAASTARKTNKAFRIAGAGAPTSAY